MKDDGVHTAFELILEEIGSVSKELKQEAKRLIDKGDYEAVSGLMDTGKRLDTFQIKVRNLQTEWISSFDPNTRSKTHFGHEEIELPIDKSLALTMTYGEALAEAEFLGKNVRLLAGSMVRKEMHESLADHIKEKRKESLKKGELVEAQNSDLYELKEPMLFGSTSAAAQFVAGCSVSGPREWQVKAEGHSLKYWLSKRK